MLACLLAGAATPLLGANIETPTIHEKIDYRDIRGKSQEELVSALGRLAQTDSSGDRFSGSTHWQLSWNFRVESSGGECRVASASTDLTVATTLPRWLPPRNAPRPLVSRWKAFAAALRKHEDGHRDIAVAAAHEVARRAGETPPAGDCETLKRKLGDLADAIVREYRDKGSSYDTTTMHGRTQGATFP